MAINKTVSFCSNAPARPTSDKQYAAAKAQLAQYEQESYQNTNSSTLRKILSVLIFTSMARSLNSDLTLPRWGKLAFRIGRQWTKGIS